MSTEENAAEGRAARRRQEEADRTGTEDALEPTGHYGRVRVDQAWVTTRLAEAAGGYRRVPLAFDAEGAPVESDHHPIRWEIDPARVADTSVHAFH